LDIVNTRGLTPLVVESKRWLLLERWEQVKAGQGQVVLLSGDPGSGSRLVQVLKDHVAHEPHTAVGMSSQSTIKTGAFPLTDLFNAVTIQAEDSLTRSWRNLNTR